jgi:hypothetical protein
VVDVRHDREIANIADGLRRHARQITLAWESGKRGILRSNSRVLRPSRFRRDAGAASRTSTRAGATSARAGVPRS